jgi:prepilin-type N-terminal cleavage/methylation domain-containing protein
MMIFRKKVNSGFTLVELLVTITIFTVLTGVVLFSQSKFNSSILLTNLAYDIALTTRQAQNYGINIKEYDAGEFLPYGVHFDLSSTKSFILFADHGYYNNKEKVSPYDGGVTFCDLGHGCVNRYNIQGGNFISALCVTSGEGETCDLEKLDIIFQRPDPDAKIYAGGVTDTTYSKAVIVVTGSDGSTREVVVQANGLIQIGENI